MTVTWKRGDTLERKIGCELLLPTNLLVIEISSHSTTVETPHHKIRVMGNTYAMPIWEYINY